MASSLYKIDQYGRFGLFPGITTVALCYSSNKSLCDTLYNELNKTTEIKEFFSVLPASSFHMTTLNLYTEQEIGSRVWHPFVDSQLKGFQKLVGSLSQNKIKPIITIEGVHNRGVIQLIVSLPEEQEAKIRQIGVDMGLSSKVPTFFHITLAYQFKKIPLVQQRAIEDEIQRIIEKVIDEHGKILTLSEAKLAYFHDMTAFIEWDARSNPFHKRVLESHAREISAKSGRSMSRIEGMFRLFQNLLGTPTASQPPVSEVAKYDETAGSQLKK
ncbi:DUF1868 domain-containing protein [Legionella yabuuchiae]|uniref:DUF1868 domain-containing protein n=1 Tax=Legionella yabuuchiae TaxID=376727 RepID=UPI00105447AD|nr:DUF1868 domain-containing protein [Legionella yabuuchiae]